MSPREALLVGLAWLVAAVLLVGCADSALRVNAAVARAMLEIQSTSGPLIREQRIASATRAAETSRDMGMDAEVAQASAELAAARWQCAIDGHRVYSHAVGSYVDTLALWAASGESLELIELLPFVRRAVESYRVLAACLTSLGADVLPATPRFLGLMPEAWGVLHE